MALITENLQKIDQFKDGKLAEAKARFELLPEYQKIDRGLKDWVVIEKRGPNP